MISRGVGQTVENLEIVKNFETVKNLETVDNFEAVDNFETFENPHCTKLNYLKFLGIVKLGLSDQRPNLARHNLLQNALRFIPPCLRLFREIIDEHAWVQDGLEDVLLIQLTICDDVEAAFVNLIPFSVTSDHFELL